MMPVFADVESASENLSQYLRFPTPLYKSEALSQMLDADVWVKVETAGPIASFKLRGALNALLSLSGPVNRAVTSSTGNHGQAVAYAARLLGVPADIFVPDGCVREKLTAIERFGGRLFIGGSDIDYAKERARAHAANQGGTFIDDGENSAVIAGAGTIGLEAARILPDIDVALVPMGSGSLAGGVALGLKGIQPTAKVWAIQSSGAPAMVASFHAKRVVERPTDTIGDCLVCRVPATVALGTILSVVDDAYLVDDASLLRSMRTLVFGARVLVEPGAAAGLAGAWARRDQLRGRRVMLVLTGANASEAALAQALAGPGIDGGDDRESSSIPEQSEGAEM